MRSLLTALKFFLVLATLAAGSGQSQTLEKGVLDLRGWDSEEQPMLKLDGEAEFYWQQWIATDKLPTDHPGFIKIPSSWNIERDLPAYGYASYRFRVKLPAVQEIRLLFGGIYSSARFWVDGRLVKTIGQLGKSPETAVGDLLNAWDYSFTPKAAEFELIVEVANFDIFLGGMMAPVYIGTQAGVGQFLQRLTAFSFFLVGMLMIMSFYHFGLYFLRRSDRSTLFYGLLCFWVGTYVLSGDPSEAWSLVTPFGFEGRILAYNLSWIFCVTSFLLYTKSLFPKEMSSRLVYGISIFSVLYLATISFLKVRTYVASTQTYQLVPAIGILYTFLVMARAYRLKRDGARVFFFSIIILFATVIHDLIMLRGLFTGLPLAGLGVFIFTFCQSYLISARFSHAFDRAEHSEAEVRQLAGTLEIRVEEQTREIRSIMQSIELGIFAIHGPEQVIHKDYSLNLERILEKESLENEPALPLLFAQSNISEDQKHQVQSVVLASLGESVLNFELNKESFPRSMVRYTKNGEMRNFEIGWNPILNDAEEVDKLLVTVNDVTDLRKWEQEARHSAEELSMVAEIINIRESEFLRFIKSSKELLQQNILLLTGPDTAVPLKEIHKVVLMNLHTIKGAARTLQFRALADSIHGMEQAVGKDTNQHILDDHQQMFLRIEEYQRLAQEKLGRTLDHQLRLLLPADEALHAYDALQDTHDPTFDPLLLALQEQIFTPLPELMQEILRSADSLARDLDKPRPIVELRAPELLVESRTDETLRHIFFHLIRNAMDHGIESAVDRVAKGKPAEGRLQLHIEADYEHLIFRLQDDGQGMQLYKIRLLAEKQGLIAPSLQLDPQMIADQMFSIGISTAPHITQISGRGIGMSAVARFIYESGGSIRIQLLRDMPAAGGGYPFATVIRLPIRLFKSPANRSTTALSAG